MAATKRNAMLIEETRKRVQTSQLLNRLHDHVFGKNDMQPTQIKAAEILLRKALPDLAAVTVRGDPENPLVSVDARMLVLQEVAEILAPKPEKHAIN